jgi:4-amino-4-deoxy-L-arabinose transferase-like glycosyltransferase
MKEWGKETSQNAILALWLVAFLAMGTIVLIQRVNDVYEPHDASVWFWLLASICPTLSLILFAVVRRGRKKLTTTVSATKVLLALVLSAVYLALLGFLLVGHESAAQRLDAIGKTGPITTTMQVFLAVGLAPFFRFP